MINFKIHCISNNQKDSATENCKTTTTKDIQYIDYIYRLTQIHSSHKKINPIKLINTRGLDFDIIPNMI